MERFPINTTRVSSTWVNVKLPDNCLGQTLRNVLVNNAAWQPVPKTHCRYGNDDIELVVVRRLINFLTTRTLTLAAPKTGGLKLCPDMLLIQH